MITFKQSGNFKNTENLLSRAATANVYGVLQKYGQEGVDILSAATPIDSGKTASSWSYQIVKKNTSYQLVWNNSNIENGVPVVVLIQYGHATKNGGYVQGIDFINPAMKPLFDKIAEDVWREVITV